MADLHRTAITGPHCATPAASACTAADLPACIPGATIAVLVCVHLTCCHSFWASHAGMGGKGRTTHAGQQALRASLAWIQFARGLTGHPVQPR
jgi:hypothetical protein